MLKLTPLCEQGLILEISTGPYDPQKVFTLPKHRK
jgi:hypothetical protein